MDPTIATPTIYEVARDFGPWATIIILSILTFFRLVPSYLKVLDARDARRMGLAGQTAESFLTPFLENQAQQTAAMKKLADSFSDHCKHEEANERAIRDLTLAVSGMSSQMDAQFTRVLRQIDDYPTGRRAG